MEIRLLGSVALSSGSDDSLFGVPSGKVRTVLAVLALSPAKSIASEQFVDELWLDKPIGNARNALQANIVRLRKFLERRTGRAGDELVRTVQGGYRLDVDPQTVDAERFVALAERGGELVDSHPEQAVVLLERALRLWRGPALLDTDTLRCRLEAVRLDERRLTAQEDLITAKLAIGQERAVVSELRRLTAEYPERERFSGQLMVALYRNGRQTEAVNVFHRTRQRLVRDLGLEPGRELRKLYESILIQDQVLG
ncbi:AfsR/SARP family transcriptional regulator [Saccharopolyspora gloriosae]|uniref:AfsR/SARP family transcriptional regulator n=1 Tax=Saccharopolyspora gloriosae TaxID=455344 RepID=UPI00161DB4D6|nr:AfsR/SARP family transcriptional regulator [Saccharopolyspora gloriosae]